MAQSGTTKSNLEMADDVERNQGTARNAPKPAAASDKDSMKETAVTLIYFALWYIGSTGYNIYNKKALNAVPIPYAMSWVQLFTGIPYVCLLWATGLRKTPKLSLNNVKTLVPISLGHLGTHIGGVVAMGAGAVSFTQIIKASEPAVSAVFSMFILGHFYSPQTYATLLPIIGGVALASLKELSFSWISFWGAMLSNVSSALRAILAKKTMGGGVGENMTEANLYAVLTILSTILQLPLSLAVEPPSVVIEAVNTAEAKGVESSYIWGVALTSGVFYYLYNEIAFLALGRVTPVTHAVANTMKRVVIIVASVIVFNTPVTPLGGIGASVAILGTLLYSLSKQRYG